MLKAHFIPPPWKQPTLQGQMAEDILNGLLASASTIHAESSIRQIAMQMQ
jgi:hypothetical protein